jgi:hypothetical protein
MHEVFITRGDVAGNEELMSKIMQPWNCVLVHHGVCHERAATTEGQTFCIRYLLKKVGFITIMQELADLDEAMKGRQARDAMRLASDIYSEERENG